ncbi:hypothetical protein CROQUDRAFT_660487 [Cronartium quercuum f. sp. fusiforme G11]|uniref:Velvet domain-containing protein n=1 Tax=Cronartium quercuum f. sp. fusiforme G11 TaxID=708437 RepID=A0A9P6NI14_9BASI|nr:hypothetical protein CROQUDRAFT_660487 [Cronartium quercuum f. sp. fusiforme G11]
MNRSTTPNSSVPSVSTSAHSSTLKYPPTNRPSNVARLSNTDNSGPSQYQFVLDSKPSQSHPPYQLIVRQQPSSARICSFKDKIDRRPLDPPPIIEIQSPGHEPTLKLNFDPDAGHDGCLLTSELHINSNLCLIAHLVTVDTHEEVRSESGAPCTAGTIVQSPHRLRDLSGRFAVFFAFPDISIRLEGTYRLEFQLYSVSVAGRASGPLVKVFTTPFRVMPPKFFPGMASSSELTRHLAEQGFKLRVRKKTRTIINRKKVKRQAECDPINPVLGSLDSPELHQPPSSVCKRKRAPRNMSSFDEPLLGTSRSEIGVSPLQNPSSFPATPAQKGWQASLSRESDTRLPPLHHVQTGWAQSQDRPKMEMCLDDSHQYPHSRPTTSVSCRPKSMSSSDQHVIAPASSSTLCRRPPRPYHDPSSPYGEPSWDSSSHPPEPRQIMYDHQRPKELPRPASLLASRPYPSTAITPPPSSTNKSSVGPLTNSPASSQSLAPIPPSDYSDRSSGACRLPSSSDMLALAYLSGERPIKTLGREGLMRVGSKDIPDVWDKMAF